MGVSITVSLEGSNHPRLTDVWNEKLASWQQDLTVLRVSAHGTEISYILSLAQVKELHTELTRRIPLIERRKQRADAQRQALREETERADAAMRRNEAASR